MTKSRNLCACVAYGSQRRSKSKNTSERGKQQEKKTRSQARLFCLARVDFVCSPLSRLSPVTQIVPGPISASSHARNTTMSSKHSNRASAMCLSCLSLACFSHIVLLGLHVERTMVADGEVEREAHRRRERCKEVASEARGRAEKKASIGKVSCRKRVQGSPVFYTLLEQLLSLSLSLFSCRQLLISLSFQGSLPFLM